MHGRGAYLINAVIGLYGLETQIKAQIADGEGYWQVFSQFLYIFRYGPYGIGHIVNASSAVVL